MKSIEEEAKEFGVEGIYSAITYDGNYVDVNKLFDGLYLTQKPPLYDADETIENLVKVHLEFFGKYMKDSPVDIYINNLKQCKMVRVKISITPPTPTTINHLKTPL